MEANDKKDRFFTPERIWWCLIYDLLLIGFFSSYIWFQVSFLGNNVEVQGLKSSFEKRR